MSPEFVRIFLLDGCPLWFVFTPICKSGSKGCSYDVLNDKVLYYFSYPEKGLIPSPPSLDGRPLVAYVINPIFGDINDPSDFDTPVGRIVQIRVPGGGIQNITLRDHAMTFGTITRQIKESNGMLGIWTHGIGINKFTSFDVINRKLARDNDILGPKAFSTIDKQAKQYWEKNYGQ